MRLQPYLIKFSLKLYFVVDIFKRKWIFSIKITFIVILPHLITCLFFHPSRDFPHLPHFSQHFETSPPAIPAVTYVIVFVNFQLIWGVVASYEQAGLGCECSMCVTPRRCCYLFVLIFHLTQILIITWGQTKFKGALCSPLCEEASRGRIAS